MAPKSSSHERSEIYTADIFIPEPSLLKLELVIEKFKIHKAPKVEQILTELIHAGGGKFYEEIHKFTILIWKNEEFPKECKRSIIFLIP